MHWKWVNLFSTCKRSSRVISGFCSLIEIGRKQKIWSSQFGGRRISYFAFWHNFRMLCGLFQDCINPSFFMDCKYWCPYAEGFERKTHPLLHFLSGGFGCGKRLLLQIFGIHCYAYGAQCRLGIKVFTVPRRMSYSQPSSLRCTCASNNQTID